MAPPCVRPPHSPAHPPPPPRSRAGEWGIPSRDGWTVYDDSVNFALDENDWWSTSGGERQCQALQPGLDAANPSNSGNFPQGTTVADAAACCAACMSDPSCVAGYVFDTKNGDSPNCWPLSSVGGRKAAADRTLALVSNPSSSNDVADLYGFFHGHDYIGALADFVAVSGKTIMVPKYTAGVWNSRWYDYSSQDNLKLVDDYKSRRIPLDVFVIDMDWHVRAAACALAGSESESARAYSAAPTLADPLSLSPPPLSARTIGAVSRSTSTCTPLRATRWPT